MPETDDVQPVTGLDPEEPPLQLLRPDGTLNPGVDEPPLEDAEVVDAYRLMRLSRAFDKKAISLQRQGRSGTFAPGWGQEASVVGSSLALDPEVDWVVPQYRELAAMVRQGYPLSSFLRYVMGDPEGAGVPEGVRLLPVQAAIAAQLPHAVGLAWGLALQEDPGVVMTYFGDGASSEGDFHEACNLAGVTGAPVVFFLQNNGWAISVPRHEQTAAANLASRAVGYGFPGERVDGNDLLAVYVAARRAVERARAGEGPSLIESMTYRVWSHTTADDNTRYVDAEEHERRVADDPIERVRRYLRGRGALDEVAEDELGRSVEDEVAAAVKAAEDLSRPHPSQVIDHVFVEPPVRLRRQGQRLVELYAPEDN